RDLELIRADSQESQNPCDGPVNASDEILEFLESVQRLNGLPALAVCERRQIPSHTRQRAGDLRVDGLAQLRVEFHPPHERGEHRNDIRRVVPAIALSGHATRTATALDASPSRARVSLDDLQLALGFLAGAVFSGRLDGRRLLRLRRCAALHYSLELLAPLRSLSCPAAEETFFVAHGTASWSTKASRPTA